MSKKVVVIDEVHAYDAYMSQYLYMAIKWMAAYQIPVIILSATLPGDKRAQLIQEYAEGLGLDNSEIDLPEDLSTNTSYPLITCIDGKKAKQITSIESTPSKEIEIVDLKDEDLEDRILECYASGAVVGVIVNTVRRAQEIAEGLIERLGKDSESILLLHSSLISTDRIKREKQLLDLIGKDAERPSSYIVVGTQVLEQSLDIDFDVLITDLCPIDLLIQRMGRLHRHEIGRPAGFEEPIVYLLGRSSTYDFEGGSSAVYGEYLLARSQYFLGQSIRVPDEVSSLVQTVYLEQDGDLELSDELSAEYDSFKEKNSKLINEKERKAGSFRIDDPITNLHKRVLRKERYLKESTLMGWLRGRYPDGSEEGGRAQVRDSGDRIEVIPVKRKGDGYTLVGEDEEISCRIGEYEVARRLAQSTLDLPNIFCRPYIIDRTIKELEEKNRAELSVWQQTSWLKGSLGLVFDDGEAELCGYILRYDEVLGLRVEKAEANG